MKTIEEVIDNIVDEHKECRWMDASELREYLECVAKEQKAIDDDHLREVKKMLIDRAYSWLVHILDDDRSFIVWRDFKKFMMEE